MHQNRAFSMSNPVCNHQTHLDTSVHCEWAHPFTRASSVFKIGDLGVISGFARDDLATAGRLEKCQF